VDTEQRHHQHVVPVEHPLITANGLSPEAIHLLILGGWDPWVAACGLMMASVDVWLIVFFRGFLNSLARAT